MAFPAFLDTCVLYGANLNDTLLRIAEEDAFSPQWSPDVVEELRRNLSMIPNLPAGAADRRVKADSCHVGLISLCQALDR